MFAACQQASSCVRNICFILKFSTLLETRDEVAGHVARVGTTIKPFIFVKKKIGTK